MKDSRRIFFALWPEPEIRQRLAAVQRQLDIPGRPGRAVRVDGLHLTLAFVGDVTSARVDCCRSAAGSVRCEPFALKLDTLDCFQRARVAWIGPSGAPEPLLDLFGRLNEALSCVCDFTPEEIPYRPHVTLMRGVYGLPPVELAAPVEWTVRRFCLLESRTGMAYEVLREYPLATGAGHGPCS